MEEQKAPKTEQTEATRVTKKVRVQNVKSTSTPAGYSSAGVKRHIDSTSQHSEQKASGNESKPLKNSTLKSEFVPAWKTKVSSKEGNVKKRKKSSHSQVRSKDKAQGQTVAPKEVMLQYNDRQEPGTPTFNNVGQTNSFGAVQQPSLIMPIPGQGSFVQMQSAPAFAMQYSNPNLSTSTPLNIAAGTNECPQYMPNLPYCMNPEGSTPTAPITVIYKKEIEAYQALTIAAHEREKYILWLEGKLKEYGLMDPEQPSAVPLRANEPYSSTKQSDDAQKSADARKEGGRDAFSTRDFLRGDDTPDLISDRKLGRVNFIQPGTVPKFIQDELRSTPGNGQFTICELMVTLCFAHQLLFHRNTYSTIKKRMLNKRSRASIRRKIEKIVFKETGLDGGLLLAPQEKRVQILSCLWSRFAKLLEEAITYGAPSLEAFAKRLRDYANMANATEKNINAGTAWKLKSSEKK